METRTYYFPENRIGHYIVGYIIARVGCSIGNIRRVADHTAISIITTKHNFTKIERILQMYDLM